jgi:hypothetical protein
MLVKVCTGMRHKTCVRTRRCQSHDARRAHILSAVRAWTQRRVSRRLRARHRRRYGYAGTVGSADLASHVAVDRVATPPELQAHFAEKASANPYQTSHRIVFRDEKRYDPVYVRKPVPLPLHLRSLKLECDRTSTPSFSVRPRAA